MQSTFKKLSLFMSCLLLVVSFCFLTKTSAATAEPWTKVSENGFGHGNENYDVGLLFNYNNNLIASASGHTDGVARVYRSSDGTTWTQTNESGFGENDAMVMCDLELNDYLYCLSANSATGMKLWRTNDMSIWQKVGDDVTGLGNLAEATDMTVFNGDIYVDFYTSTSKSTVWKSAGGINSWSEAIATDFLAGDFTSFNIVTFGNYIYISFYRAAGGAIYRSSNGTNWSLVIDNGIDDPDNLYINLEPYNGYLWVATETLNQLPNVYRSSDGVNYDKITIGNFNSHSASADPTIGYSGWMYFSVGINDLGPTSELWRYKDGTWELYAQESLGDNNNFTLMGVTNYKDYMYLGTFNTQAGGAVWRRAADVELPQTGADL